MHILLSCDLSFLSALTLADLTETLADLTDFQNMHLIRYNIFFSTLLYHVLSCRYLCIPAWIISIVDFNYFFVSSTLLF